MTTEEERPFHAHIAAMSSEALRHRVDPTHVREAIDALAQHLAAGGPARCFNRTPPDDPIVREFYAAYLAAHPEHAAPPARPTREPWRKLGYDL
jgi:hypothetical protein